MPAFLKLEVGLDEVTVSWSFDEANNTQFEVFRKDSLNGNYESVGLVSDLFYEDQGLTPGDYWYRVYAVSGESRSKGSNGRKATIVE